MIIALNPTVRFGGNWVIGGQAWRHAVVWTVVFSGGFVAREPAPYDLLLTLAFPLLLLAGLTINRALAPLTWFVALFVAGGILSLTQLHRWANTEPSDAIIYVAVSAFLAGSALFFAALVAQSQQRLKLIFNAYTISAIATTLLGIVGYFGLIPGAGIFTRFGRAMGAFQDPNVFGPYLLLPLIFLVLSLLQGASPRPIRAVLTILLLMAGIFLSFSRGAWAMTAFSLCAAFFVSVISQPDPRLRLRQMVAMLAGVALFLVLFAVALAFDEVRELFFIRAQLLQSYDAGEWGRFGRMFAGLELAAGAPLGIGATSFSTVFFAEEPHNTALKTFLVYGWLGGASFLLLILTTLIIGFTKLFRPGLFRRYYQAAYITLFAHILLSAIIDMDHWRHFYLVLGLVWGCFAADRWAARAANPALKVAKGRGSSSTMRP